MRAGEHDENYLWLRQSVTFTANGQTRTLEIAIPVRRGSTPDEIETMLDEADAGMARLSRRLDAHLADQLPSSLPARQTTIAEAPGETLAPPPMPVPARTPAPTVSPAATQPATPRPGAAPTPAPAPAVTTAPIPASHPERPAAPAPTRPAPARPAASTPSAASIPAGPPMTIPQFIAAIGELELNPKQAMDRLNVRTLSGLNLREALETLRRQMLQSYPSAAAAPPPVPAPVSPPPPAPQARPVPTTPAPSPAPTTPASAHFFEEEDDYTFGLDDEPIADDLEGGDEFAALLGGNGAHPTSTDDEEEPAVLGDEDFDLLADLPDFDALAQPPAEPEPMPPTRTPSRAATTRPMSAPASQAAHAPMSAGPSGPLAGPEHARALRRIGQMRSAQGGSAATPYQRNAYKNLVVGQLGETTATSLVRGLWRTTPAQLTGDQLDALKGWAKEDAFTEDVPLVLEALRAERARAARENGTAEDAASPTPEANRPPQPRRASGSRGEPAGGH